jgi:hypothetical protein
MARIVRILQDRIKEQIDHSRKSVSIGDYLLSAGAGGRGSAMSVAIRHPSGVLIQVRIIRNSFEAVGRPCRRAGDSTSLLNHPAEKAVPLHRPFDLRSGVDAAVDRQVRTIDV